MKSALYNRDILRLASSLVPGDHLEHAEGAAEARSPICGSRIQAEIAMDENGTISRLALRANACALGQASAAILRANGIGCDLATIALVRAGIADALTEKTDMPECWPSLSVLAPAKDYPARHPAILLPYDALLAAAEQMKRAS